MLATFIGSPCSGKTTTAALVFSSLKESGVTAEFLPEQARIFIARKRILTNEKIVLSDIDQMFIMQQQLEMEELLVKSSGSENTVVVTDASSLNAILYMSEEARNEASVQEMIVRHRKLFPLTFWVNTVQPGFSSDPNRVHDLEFSRNLDSKIPDIFTESVPWLQYIHLVGDSRHRTSNALSYIFAALLSK